MTKVSQGKAISEGEKRMDCCTGNNTTFAFIINSVNFIINSAKTEFNNGKT